MKDATESSSLAWSISAAVFSLLGLIGFERFSFVIPVSIIASAYGLYLGSDIIVDQSSNISSRLGLSRKKEGFLVLSVAAIADELFLTIIAASLGFGDISFGAVQGSNDFTLASVIIIVPILAITAKLDSFRKDIGFLFLSAFIVLILSYMYGLIPIYIAPIFIAVFIIYLVFAAYSESPAPEPMERGKTSPALFTISILLLFISSFSLVVYADYISRALNINGFLGGFLLTGITGSIPEIMIIFITARKSRIILSMAVLIGSTIYKLTLVLGVITLFGNLTFDYSKWSTYLLILMTFMLLLMSYKALKRYHGIVLAALIIGASIILYGYA
jgi:cation:H+ antiporter